MTLRKYRNLALSSAIVLFAAIANAGVSASGSLPEGQNVASPSPLITIMDQQNCAGGPGMNCNSGTVNCSSGRSISCYANVGNNSYRSLCCQQTGNVGWVACSTYDGYGNTTSSFSDSCP